MIRLITIALLLSLLFATRIYKRPHVSVQCQQSQYVGPGSGGDQCPRPWSRPQL